ncbi:MAG: hypothetical protein ACO1NM_09855 [Sphingobium phenoxybenzoativorans]
MSSRFWIVGGAVMLLSIAAGYGLGGFAGGRFGGGVWQDLRGYENTQAEAGSDEQALSDTSVSNLNPADGGDLPPTPDEIVCKGCGPTLAERNMMGNAYAIGENDPALRDYEAQGDSAEHEAAAPPTVVATVKKAAPGAAGMVEPTRPAQQQ